MTILQKVILRVPGAEIRYGTYVEDLGFDDFVRIAVTHYEDNGKTKPLGPNQLYSYLARRRNVEEIKNGNET